MAGDHTVQLIAQSGGADDEGAALGAAGRVVGIADPAALADAAVEIIGKPEVWRAARAAGIARVERYYADSMMFGAYQKVYDKALGLPATEGPAKGGPA